MSTNKTKNYKLHCWEPSDDFLRAEMNENFAKLDAAIKTEALDLDGRKVEAVFGSYMGGQPENQTARQTIELGQTPRAVIVTVKDGFAYNSGRYGSAMAGPGCAAGSHLSLEEGGFSVSNGGSTLLNFKGYTYYYLALL